MGEAESVPISAIGVRVVGQADSLVQHLRLQGVPGGCGAALSHLAIVGNSWGIDIE